MRKAASTSFWVISIGIASAIVGVFILGATMGNFWNAVGQSDRVSTGVTARRMSQAVELVSVLASSSYSVEMDREYEKMEISDGKLVFYDGEQEIETLFTERITTSFQEVTSICVSNSGEINVGKNCQLENCEEDTCLEREGYGYFCEEGVLTGEDFYRKNFENCKETEETFFNLDFVSCPDKAEPGAMISCSAGITYRCEGEERSIKTEFGTEEEEHTLSCTGRIETENIVITTAASSEDKEFSIKSQETGIEKQEEVGTR